MSADDAVFVQRNKAGQLVAQYGFMSDDVIPDPETAKISETFDRLAEVVNARLAAASETEYGFQFIGDVLRVGQPGDVTFEPQAELVDASRVQHPTHPALDL